MGPQKTDHLYLASGAASAISLPYAAEIAFVDFDLASQFRRFHGQSFREDDAQSMVELGLGDLVHADQKASRSSWRPGNEVFQQLFRLYMREF